MWTVSDSIKRSWMKVSTHDLLDQQYKLGENNAKKTLSLARVSYLVTFLKMGTKKGSFFLLIPSKIILNKFAS